MWPINHQVGIRQTPGIAGLIGEFGYEGYGLYWAILEVVHYQLDARLKKIPGYINFLAQMLGTEETYLSKLILALSSKFFLLENDDNFLWCPQTIQAIEQSMSIRAKRADAGRIGGLTKAINKMNPEQKLAKLNLLQRATKAKENKENAPDVSSPTPLSSLPLKETKENYSTDFESFWKAYPKRRSKGDAFKAWRALNATKEQVSCILAAIYRATRSSDWVKEGGQFIPFPGTWLRARGWEDEYAVTERKSEVVG